MPISKRPSAYNKKKVANSPNTYGIYELLDKDGEVVYIGQGRIKDRLNDHFLSGGADPIPQASKFRYEETKSKIRAEQRERAELSNYESKKGKLPRHNKKRG